MGGVQHDNFEEYEGEAEKDEMDDDRRNAEKVWKTVACAT